jgi:hypothetical protein
MGRSYRARTVLPPVLPRAAEYVAVQERRDPVCASLFDEAPNEHPTRGWNRASLAFWSRKPYRPRLTAEDREIPNGRGPRMLALCAATGGLLSLSLLWFVFFLVSMYDPVPGGLRLVVIAGVAVVLTLVLYAVSARRGREYS